MTEGYSEGYMLVHRRSGEPVFAGGISKDYKNMEPREAFKDEYAAVKVKLIYLKPSTEIES